MLYCGATKDMHQIGTAQLEIRAQASMFNKFYCKNIIFKETSEYCLVLAIIYSLRAFKSAGSL